MRFRHVSLVRYGLWLFAGCLLLFLLRHTPLPQKVPGLLALAPAGYLEQAARFDLFNRFNTWLGLPLAALYRVDLLFVLALLFGVYFLALRHARAHAPSGGELPIILAGAALCSLPLLFLPYMLSRDVYSYIVYGRMAAIYGANPALTPPLAYPADPYFQYLVSWKDTPSVYGPVWTLLSHALTLLVEWAGGGIWRYMLAYKLAMAAAHLGAAALIWGTLARWKPERRAWGTLLYAWNPVALIEFAGSGHNDVLLVFFVLLAVFCVRREWWRRATLALVAAALVKWIALLLLPLAALLWLRRGEASIAGSRRARSRPYDPIVWMEDGRSTANASSAAGLPARRPVWFGRSMFAAQIAALALGAAVLAHLPYGELPRALVAPLATQSEMKSENTIGALAVGGAREVLWRLGDAAADRPEWRREADVALGLAGKAAVLAGWLVAAYAVWRRPTFTRFLEAGGWLFLAMLLVAPVFRVWYVTWPLALVALLEWRPLARIVVAFSASAPLIYLHWGTHGWSDLLVYVPVLALVARYLWRDRARNRARVLALWVSRGATA